MKKREKRREEQRCAAEDGAAVRHGEGSRLVGRQIVEEGTREEREGAAGQRTHEIVGRKRGGRHGLISVAYGSRESVVIRCARFAIGHVLKNASAAFFE